MKTQKLMLLVMGFCLTGFIYGQEMALNSSSEDAVPAVASLAWEKTTIDVGMVRLNNPVQVEYTFTNTSGQPVVITNVSTSCGCTAAKNSQEPVKPGESSKITVTYNAKTMGVFHKTVTVKTSADQNPIILTLSGEVK